MKLRLKTWENLSASKKWIDWEILASIDCEIFRIFSNSQESVYFFGKLIAH